MALPVPAAAYQSPYGLIEATVVQRVAAALNMGVEFVRPVANDDYRVTETENVFAYIRSFGPSPVNPSTGQSFPDYGAGRYSRIVGRRFRVYVYTRSGVDVVGGDEVALSGTPDLQAQVVTTPPTMPGQYVVEELILNALDNEVMTYTVQSKTYPLTIGPIHWVDSADGPPVRKAENEDGLVRSHLDFQVVYRLTYQHVEPAPATGDLPVPDHGN